jgi:hypothetical protein
MNAMVEEALAITPARDIAGRVRSLDWERVSQDLDAQGSAMIEGLITREECDALAELYPIDDIFRSRVVMGRHGFGRGEYKYFSYPAARHHCWPPDGHLPASCADRQSLERSDGHRRSLPGKTREFHRALP